VLALFASSLTALSEERTFRQDLILHYTFDQRDGEPVLNEGREDHRGQAEKAKFVAVIRSGRALMMRDPEVESGYVETADHAET